MTNDGTQFRVVFDVGNAAFDPMPELEIARILRETADRVEAGRSDGPVHDVNGNRIGKFGFRSG